MSANKLLLQLLSLSLVDWLIIGISLYIIYESLEPIGKMREGFCQFCHKCKYVLSFVSALAFIIFTWRHVFTPYEQLLVLQTAITIALFVWPRTVWRIKQECTFTWPEIES